jgi:heme oxygenase (biliverdin-IX-beta and delta-forming)
MPGRRFRRAFFAVLLQERGDAGRAARVGHVECREPVAGDDVRVRASRGDWRYTICDLEHDVLSRIRDLLSTTRVLSLAVIVEGQAEAALLPFVARDDFRAVHVQASSLARHTRGLTTGARVGVLVHEPDTTEADPMQLSRLTVQAVVSILDKDTGQFAAAAARFAGRFPTAGTTLSLGDFRLYELTLGRGRYVEGFARAFNVGPQTFAEISAL